MYMKRNKRLEIENKIKEFCTNESKKLKEIQIFTGGSLFIQNGKGRFIKT